MLHQIVRQQMCLLRQRIRSPQIAFLQRRTRAAHIVSDLSHRLLLSRIEGASCQQFQLVVGRAQQPLRVLALVSGFRGSHVGRNLRRRFARSALANHNLPRTPTRRRRGALAAFRGGARRTICLLRCHALRSFRPRIRRTLCCSRRRSFSGRIRGARRLLLLRGHPGSRETQTKRNREPIGKSHNRAKRIVSHRNQERKGSRFGWLNPPTNREYLQQPAQLQFSGRFVGTYFRAATKSSPGTAKISVDNYISE